MIKVTPRKTIIFLSEPTDLACKHKKQYTRGEVFIAHSAFKEKLEPYCDIAEVEDVPVEPTDTTEPVEPAEATTKPKAKTAGK